MLLLEVTVSVFSNYKSLIRNIETYFNYLLDGYGYTVYIKPITDKANFWKTVNSFEYLYNVTFVMHMPNFGGATQEEVKDLLNYYRKNNNATTLTVELLNEDGN